jgi:septum formation protein
MDQMTDITPLSPPSNARFVLASASPRRLDLLAQIGLIPDAVDPADLDESPHRAELPRVYAARMAEEKARAVASRHIGAFVLAADTVVACGRRILPKTETEAEAARCLDLLSGRRHKVLGGVTVIGPDAKTAPGWSKPRSRSNACRRRSGRSISGPANGRARPADTPSKAWLPPM